MIKISELSTTVKTIAGGVTGAVAILGVVYTGYAHFTTDAEASEAHGQITEELHDYQEQQFKADKADRLDRFQREIDRIDYELISESLTAQQREYLKRKRHDIERKMECVEGGKC